MSKKRVGHVTFHYYPVVGGQEIYIQNLMSVLEENGYSNVVYQPSSRNANFFTKSIDKRVRLVFSVPILNKVIKNFKKFTFSFFLLFRIFSLIKDDVIIVHYAFHSWPLIFFKKKVIVLSHGVEWDLRYNHLIDKLHYFIARKTFNIFNLVVNDTHYLRTFSIPVSPATHYFEEVDKQKWFIPNCVSTANFTPVGASYKYTEGRKFILVPRQITVDRGIDVAIEAFSALANEYHDVDMLIAGPVRDPEYKLYCDAMIKELQLESRIVWNHSVSNSKIATYYRGALLTLIPTLRREGTSLSALEAMACKCPVVTTNVAGLADLPTLQAEPQKNLLAEKMRECIKERDKVSSEQHLAVSEVFNEKNWTNAWLDVIKTTLARANGN